MSKSIYSLLLTDEVVHALDRMAAKRNMSRSSFIDSLLAEHTGRANVDTLYRRVWNNVENLFERMHTMQFVNNAQLSLAQVVTSLPFKYNPKVRYCLELSDEPHTLCKISLSTRTQSPVLSAVFGTFYNRFAQLEDIYLDNVSATYDNGKYTSVLYGNAESPEQTAVQIVEYIVTLDGMLRAFLCGDEDASEKLFVSYATRHAAANKPHLLPQ